MNIIIDLFLFINLMIFLKNIIKNNEYYLNFKFIKT